MSERITDWTTPFYLQFLHGNYVNLLKGEEQQNFIALVKQAIKEINDNAIADLLHGRGWREKLTGAWFSGLTGRTQFQDRIGSLLIESSSVYSGEGYCFALACFANEKSAELLQAYLNKWLLKLDCPYDQGWAMSTLVWLDKQRATECANKFLQPGGLWESFSSNQTKIVNCQLDIVLNQFVSLMEFSKEHFGPFRK
jgi:Family of unknown function (DUF6000)